MKKLMPIIISIVITAIVSSGATYAILNIKESNNETKAEVRVDVNDNDDESSFEEYELDGAPQELVNTDNFDHTRYGFEIKSARISRNFENKPTVIVTYVFTNNNTYSNSEAESFESNFNAKAYQNGVELETTISIINDYELKGDTYADVIVGYSTEIEIAYVLNDINSDILVELEDSTAFSNEILATRTFNMK